MVQSCFKGRSLVWILYSHQGLGALSLWTWSMARALISSEMNLVCPPQSHPADWTNPWLGRKRGKLHFTISLLLSSCTLMWTQPMLVWLLLRKVCWHDREVGLVRLKELKDLRLRSLFLFITVLRLRKKLAENFSKWPWTLVREKCFSSDFFLFYKMLKVNKKLILGSILESSKTCNEYICVHLPCVLLPICICTELLFELHRLPDGQDVIIL